MTRTMLTIGLGWIVCYAGSASAGVVTYHEIDAFRAGERKKVQNFSDFVPSKRGF